jgi:MFS family permease
MVETVRYAPGERTRPRWLREHPRAWVAAVGAVCFGAFLGQLDASIVALTYHQIGAGFDASLAAVQWVSLSYLLGLGVLLIPTGSVSDRLGRKRVYLWGFAVVAIASVACAAAPNLALLDGARVVQGIGAAMLQANSVALVATAAPAGRLRTALGLQAAAQALGLALGPTLGGVLVQYATWRWVFIANVPIALLGLLLGRYLLPRTRLPQSRRRQRVGSVLRVRALPTRLAGALLAYLLLFGPIVLVPLVLQAHGVTAATAGLCVAALAAGFAVAAPTADRLLPAAWSPELRCRTGLILTGAGLLAALAAGPHVATLAPCLLLVGVGLGVYTPANNALIMASVPRDSSALAGGLVNTMRTAGTAAATALVAAVVSAAGSTGALTGGLMILLAAVVLAAATVRSPRAVCD